MKKLSLILVLTFCSLSFAQIQGFDSTYINDLKTDVWRTYKEIVKQNLKMTPEQADIFWPLFDEYMAAHDPIVDKRVKLTENYMMNYYSLDDATAKELIKKAIESEEEELDMKKEYINKMLEKLPAPLVGKFAQIDARVSALIDLVRMSSIPLVRTSEEK
jgi:hypothetical protein